MAAFLNHSGFLRFIHLGKPFHSLLIHGKAEAKSDGQLFFQISIIQRQLHILLVLYSVRTFPARLKQHRQPETAGLPADQPHSLYEQDVQETDFYTGSALSSPFRCAFVFITPYFPLPRQPVNIRHFLLPQLFNASDGSGFLIGAPVSQRLDFRPSDHPFLKIIMRI